MATPCVLGSAAMNFPRLPFSAARMPVPLNPRRALLGQGAALGFACASGVPLGAAQASQTSTRFLVPLGPGGGQDTIIRLLAERFRQVSNLDTVVENRPGAESIVAVNALLSAPADGRTLMGVGPTTMIVNPLLRSDLPYDPLRDLLPLAAISRNGSFLVTGVNSRIRQIGDIDRELAARSRPIRFGNYMPSYRFQALVLQEHLNGEFVHVQYRTDAQVLTDLQGGDIELGFVGATGAGNGAASRLRLLAFTGDRRHPAYPDVPTLVDSGFDGLTFHIVNGVVVHRSTPAPLAATLEGQLLAAMRHPDMVRLVTQQGGGEVIARGGQHFADLIAAETLRFRKVVARIARSA
jgi:tripartite-type tricarboxylate transporter receptor subunit TctC